MTRWKVDYVRGGYLVIPPSQVEAACTEGFDGMCKLVTRVLGEEAWLRMVSNAPAAWEEDDALRHMSDVGYLVITPRVT